MSFNVPVELVAVGMTGLMGFLRLTLHALYVITGRLGDIRVDIALLKKEAQLG